jgi:brefeldin A-inhibited guanine nucleotide-exchange protein
VSFPIILTHRHVLLFWRSDSNVFDRLCADIIRSFVRLDEETQNRNIIAWRPVVVDVIDGYNSFPQDGFDKYIETFYPITVELLSRDLSPEIRVSLQGLLRRIGEVRLGVAPPNPLDAPISPRSSVSQKMRRESQ